MPNGRQPCRKLLPQPFANVPNNGRNNMQRELIPGTQATLFNELPNGQRTLFNGIPPTRGRNPVSVAPSTLELIGDEIDRHCAERRPMKYQNGLF
jgi:hypothetical protein